MKRDPFLEDNFRSDRKLTACLFAIMIICISVVIHIVPMPTRAGIEQSLETFVLESMAMAINRPDEPEPVNEIEEEISEEETLEDFDELLSSFMNLDPVESSLSDVESQDRSAESRIQTELDLEFSNSSEMEEFGIGLEDLDLDLFPQAERGKGILVSSNIGSEFTRSSGIPFTNRTKEISTDDLTIRNDNNTRLQILESVYEGLDRSTLTLEETLKEDAVVLWLKKFQGISIDPVMRTLLELESTDLTYKDTVILGGQKQVVMQLAYSPINRTLKIVIIEGNTLYYFIDPGLQDRANNFEKGHVVHDTQSIVISVESEEISVQSSDAVQMFNLFLSWWKTELLKNG